MNDVLKWSALLVALAAPIAAHAQIGNFTGTSTPTVVTPQTSPAPQTPAQPTLPPGANGPSVGVNGGLSAAHNHVAAPRVVTPHSHM